MRQKNGNELPMALTLSDHDVGGEPLVIAAAHDVCGEQGIQQLELLEPLDSLTGLPGRRTLHRALGAAFERVRRHEASFALVVVDVDRFKEVNDHWGHLTGDTLLREIARRLIDGVRQCDLVVRFGGDEFVILLEGVQCPRELRSLCRRMRRSVQVPIELDGHPVFLSVSVGGAIASEVLHSAELLLRAADEAMYRAKRSCPSWDKCARGNEPLARAWKRPARTQIAPATHLAPACLSQSREE
jgi:diguanylate cyclase (GGDEF)-like protein